MARYLAARVAQSVVVLLASTAVLFAAFFVLPGDPFAAVAGTARAREPAVRAHLEQRYGLDRPVHVRYARYVAGLARGDLGESFRLRRPVTQVVVPKAANTARLAAAAMLLVAVLGVASGAIAAATRRRTADVAVTLTTTLLIGLPVFVTGLLIQQALAIQWRVLPAGGTQGLRALVAPAITLAVVDAAILARLVRGSTGEVLRADFVRAARAKGLTAAQVTWRHAVPNAILPAITYLGIAFGTLLGGALVVEVIFDYDGLGRAAVVAVQTQDHPVVLGVAVLAVAAFVTVNLLVDLAYAAVDPRVRLRGRA